MIVHFDADLLTYRCGFAAEKMHYMVDGQEFQYKKDAVAYMDSNDVPVEELQSARVAEPVENALYNVKSIVNKTLEDLGCTEDDVIMYLSGPDNYRNEIATIKPYKGNRDAAHKPVHGPAIREYIQDKYDCVMSDGEEADDVVGYSHYKMYCQDPYSSTICTVDKDIDMIPGLHYNFVKEESYYVDDRKADKYFYLQLLKGDPTDNIPGLPGVGDKGASRLLEGVSDPLEMYKIARAQYNEKYEDGDAALLENALLLWIRRHPNEFWHPPEEENAD